MSCLGILLASGRAWGQAQCAQTTHCRANGHSTMSQSLFPYTEDITDDTKIQTPVTTPQNLSGPTLNWTMISGPCTELQGNLNGTNDFNALLRAQIQVHSAQGVAANARYEVQLQVDGQEYGWYVRRLRGVYPQLDVFAAMAPVKAGWHQYTVWARLLDAGTITLSNTYTMAQGSPNYYAGAKSVNANPLTMATTFFQPVTDSVTVTLSEAQDLVVQAYTQIDAGTAGQTVSVRPFLDGVPQNPITTIGIPNTTPVVYDGKNYLTVITNVAAGTHTISLNAKTNGASTTFSNREIDVVGFPAGYYSTFASSTSTVLVQTPNASPQPYWVWNDGCGYWTKLLEATIPPHTGASNHMYEGYIRIQPNLTGSPLGHLVFETFYDPTDKNQSIDGGGRFITVYPYEDGAYIFGDAMLWDISNATETIRLWARKVTCGTGNTGGSFNVTDRYMWVKHIPVTNGCWYGP